MEVVNFKPGDLVRLREREWVVLPELRDDLLKLRPLGGSEHDATLVYLPLELKKPVPATFDPPDPERSGSREAALLFRDALRLKLRAGAGPFRSFGNLNFEPRTYQLVPLLMALRLFPTRLLVADDVGIGKTIEAGLIARELYDRGEIEQFTVICPPHLCEQWQRELAEKFNFDVEVVRTGTVARLERGLRQDESVFEVYRFTVVSLDYIKSDRRRADFLRTCPDFIIVDEAHTCVHGNPNTRHQRYQLLKGLAHSEPLRSMVLLTATPHSGNDAAFHNLLGLLNPKFKDLADLPSGEQRKPIRDELTLHFVQRRRGDIKEWENQSPFPTRESRERTYVLTGNWGELFTEVLAYARTMIQRTEGGTDLQQRMSWWAALALLRCISSSPAAAYMALRTRLRAAVGDVQPEQQLQNLDRSARYTVMDEVEDALLTTDITPAGTVEEVEDSKNLSQLIDRAKKLRGPKMDPKLHALIKEVRALVRDNFSPVIFCRFIATAHYVAENLKTALPSRTTHVIAVTGELDSSQREAEIEQLGELSDDVLPVLVATDCLSEGINLQNYFNAVIHYDLAWNPTRHEQREGRADRFGQASGVVRTLMLYGENNPIDGAIIRVILRKADQIRKELGVHVPLPVENDKLLDTVMRAALFRNQTSTVLPSLFGDSEDEVDIAWEKVKQRISRTVFAQRSLKPSAVLPEWEKTISVLGGFQDVERFVRSAADRLGAPLNGQDGYFRFPVQYLPQQLQDRLGEIGLKETTKIAFQKPPMGATHVHRTHPIVSVLADYVVEQALESNRPEIGTRCSAMFTNDVTERTVLYLLRLRFQLHVERRSTDGKYSPYKSLLAEECLGIAIRGTRAPEPLTDYDAYELLSLEPARNMQQAQKTFLIKHALDSITSIEPVFNRIAQKQSKHLLEDHRRIRKASDFKGLRYRVEPCLPVDKIGVYVFIPSVSM